MKNGLHIKVDKVKRMMSAMSALPVQTVYVGVPVENNMHEAEATTTVTKGSGKNQKSFKSSSQIKGQSSGITNSQIGFMNEFGVPEMNIPARPHLMPGIRAVKGKVANYLGQAGEYALKGDSGGVSRALNAAGITAVNSVQRKITQGPFTPLADRTIEARLARGRTGDKPLIDTGQYRRAITYTIGSGRDAIQTAMWRREINNIR